MCQRFKVAGCTVEAVRSRDLNAVAAAAARRKAHWTDSFTFLAPFRGTRTGLSITHWSKCGLIILIFNYSWHWKLEWLWNDSGMTLEWLRTRRGVKAHWTDSFTFLAPHTGLCIKHWLKYGTKLFWFQLFLTLKTLEWWMTLEWLWNEAHWTDSFTFLAPCRGTRTGLSITPWIKCGQTILLLDYHLTLKITLGTTKLAMIRIPCFWWCWIPCC